MFTRQDIKLPESVNVKPGEYVRFNALGGFMRVETYLSNGLGTIYRCNRDGSFTRHFY